MDMAIKKARNRIDHVVQDEASLRAYEMREKAILDWNSAVGYHTREAKKEGKIEVARNLLAEGSTVEFIQKITGLDIDTIKTLQMNS